MEILKIKVLPVYVAMVAPLSCMCGQGDTKPAITCDPLTLAGCNDKEKKFAAKHKENAADKVETELARLNRMKGTRCFKLCDSELLCQADR
jgi:hypothetical protein